MSATTHNLPTRAASDLAVTTIIDAYLDVAHEVAAAAGLESAWCITATALTVNVLPRLGIPGVTPVGVNIGVFNVEALAMLSRGIPRDELPSSAFVAGTKGTGVFRGDGWDGHAVVFVPPISRSATAWVVDPSGPQFSGTSAGVLIPPLRLAVPKEFLVGAQTTHSIPPQTILRLQRNFSLEGFLSFDAAEPSLIEILTDWTLERLRAKGISSTLLRNRR